MRRGPTLVLHFTVKDGGSQWLAEQCNANATSQVPPTEVTVAGKRRDVTAVLHWQSPHSPRDERNLKGMIVARLLNEFPGL